MISRGNGGNQFLGRSSSSFSSRGGRKEEFSGWKSKRRLNRRKIEGETSPGLSLAARKNHFRRLLTSLLDEKEASLRTRPPGKVAWKTASPLLSRPFLPSWVLASGRYSPRLKSMWVPEGRRSRRKRSYTPYSTRFTRRRGPLASLYASLLDDNYFILPWKGKSLVGECFLFRRVIFIPFLFFFFLTILQADEIALRFNCVIFEFRLSPEFILFGSI